MKTRTRCQPLSMDRFPCPASHRMSANIMLSVVPFYNSGKNRFGLSIKLEPDCVGFPPLSLPDSLLFVLTPFAPAPLACYLVPQFGYRSRVCLSLCHLTHSMRHRPRRLYHQRHKFTIVGRVLPPPPPHLQPLPCPLRPRPRLNLPVFRHLHQHFLLVSRIPSGVYRMLLEVTLTIY